MKIQQTNIRISLTHCALLLVVGCASVLSAPAEMDIRAVEGQFRELPPEARRLTGPLFWLHGDESQAQLEGYVEKVAQGGNGSFTTESRPHNDWLGPNWYRDVAICLEAAKKQGLKLWIFDEKWWPSQGVGGNVPPRYAAKQLHASAVEIAGPCEFEAEGYAGERHVATVAGRVAEGETIDGDSLLDLADFIEEGRLKWVAPQGKWRIMKFVYELAPGLGQGGGRELSVDGMSRDCVAWYLQTVYQPHYDRFKEDFGKTIVGFFYDEPETRGDWGTELNGVLAEMGVDWKRAYVAYAFQLSGDAQAAARYQYLEARAETWGRTMYGGITDWCEERGVQSIGHFMEHGGMYRLQDFCAGDLMRVQKYSSMGGIDAVFSQFKIGERAANDDPCWQTPKLGSSISHAYGKQDDLSMVEIFGARGQDLTYPEMKWWTDHMQVSGVNFIIPHSFNPRSPYDTDCPPYFYNSGFEPRWPLYRVFADYTSRLSVMLTGGRHVCPVALLSPGQSLHVGKGIPLESISQNLQDALYDSDWIPYEVFEDDMTFSGPRLRLRDEAYRVLVVPSVEVIPYGALAKAKAFFDHGGVVLAHGFLPTKSATVGKNAADIAKLREAIWGSAPAGGGVCRISPAGGRSYLLPEKPTPEQLQQVLAGDAGVRPTLEVLQGDTDHWLHVLHRVKAGRDVFFIANQNHLGEARTFRFRVRAEGVPECWDAMRNEITNLPHTRKEREVELDLTLEPNESVLLVFQPARRPLPPRQSVVAGESIPIVRDALAKASPPELKNALPREALFAQASWMWYPEGNPAQSAPPGRRYFRKQMNLPMDRQVTEAVFVGTADNDFTLFVNGNEAGSNHESNGGWRNLGELDVRNHLHPGLNQLAIAAVNGTDQPSPAGLLGMLRVEFNRGAPLLVPVDKTWKTARDERSRWNASDFNDSTWLAARVVAPYGSGPWGRVGGVRVTLSPVEADPFSGHCELGTEVDLRRSRVILELGTVSPEAAVRVTMNGVYAGGFISGPQQLDVTRYLKHGLNRVRIEPFAPESARLVIYP